MSNKESNAVDVKDVLAAIKKTSQLGAEIRKKLGLGINTTNIKTPDDVYQFEYKKPDLERKNYIGLHGKCIEAGQKQLLDWGYEFIQINHISVTDKSRSGVMCTYCGKHLDDKYYEISQAEKKLSRELKQQEYVEELEIRKEWEAEQILLGRM